MAAHLSPNPSLLIYDPERPDGGEYYSSYAVGEVYQPPDGSYYYTGREQPSAVGSYSTSAHDASAMTVLSNQELTSHQFYGDATAAVISYPDAYAGQSGDAWVQTKSSQPQNFYPTSAQQEAVYYDSGEASPASDDSNPAFCDSPRSETSNIADEYANFGHTNDQAYHPRSAAVQSALEYAVEKRNYERSRMGSDDSVLYENALHFSGAPHSQYAVLPNYPAAYYAEASPVEDGYSVSQGHSVDVACAATQTYLMDASYTPISQSRVSRVPARAESPMDHLPYRDIEYKQQHPQGNVPLPCYAAVNSSPFTQAPQAMRPSAPVEQPQPHYPQQQPTPPTPISIPSRSPPLIEDTPKKPLTLACFFCRKRKIACGSPPPGSQDRTCNQCARRKLQCVYPVGTRRSVRQRDVSAQVTPMAGLHIPRV